LAEGGFFMNVNNGFTTYSEREQISALIEKN